MELKEDSLSLGISLVFIMLVVYFSTYIGFPTELLLAVTLFLSGLTIQFYIRGKLKHDEEFSPQETSNIFLYTLLALGGLAVSAAAIPGIFTPAMPLNASFQNELVYGQIFAIAEERFFRGAFASFLAWKLPNLGVVSFISGGVFAVYHFAVYGMSEAFVYVLFAGIILTYVTFKCGRLTPALLAHMLNNAWSVTA